jgi:cell wall-associated NlpC family hydrolase
MHFRAVADRCAVEMRCVDWSVTGQDALAILTEVGFRVVDIDVACLARELVGTAYRRGARLSEAPHVFDCSSFTKYLYSQRGIWLPRRSIQQRETGTAVNLADARAGDLVFCSGHRDYFDTDPEDGVGHVGILTGGDTVVHAANRRLGVIEVAVKDFLGSEDAFRGVRRLIQDTKDTITLQCPESREVETSDDLRWIVLQRLS